MLKPESITRHSYLSASLHLNCYFAVQEYLPVFRSPTLFSLGLGPDLPRADEPSPGILRLSANRILTYFLATHSCILTSDTSSIPYSTPSLAYRTLFYQHVKDMFHCFGGYLSPVTFSARKLLTSELLRTL